MKPFMIGVHSDGVRNIIFTNIFQNISVHQRQFFLGNICGIKFLPQVEYANPATLAEAVAPNNAGLISPALDIFDLVWLPQ